MTAAFDELLRIETQRVDQLAGLLGFDRRRIVGWAAAQAVLTMWWHVDGSTPNREAALASGEALATLL